VFSISNNATVAIRQIIARPDVPTGTGLRIAADGDRPSLSIAVSPAPQRGDAVHGAGTDGQLFIAEEADALLQDRTIDARTDDSGRIQFVLDALNQ
jgi:hypothetical protein